MGNIYFCSDAYISCSRTDINCESMIHEYFINVRKSQEDEIGMLFADKIMYVYLIFLNKIFLKIIRYTIRGETI